MRNVGLSVFAVVAMGAALPAAAQDLAKINVSIGYEGAKSSDIVVPAYVPVAGQPAVSPAFTDGGFYKYGFNADGSVPLNERMNVVVEVGWIRDSRGDDALPGAVLSTPASHANFNSFHFGGGLRLDLLKLDSMSIFGQLIIGGARDVFDVGSGPALQRYVGQGYIENSLMVQPGGGVAVPINDALSVVGQIGYRRVFSNAGSNVIRYVLGIRYAQK
jgi:hypothetical protein